MPSTAPKRIEKTAGCCASFWSELNPFQPWFLVHDSSGYKIDIPESFAPAGPMTIIGKLLTTGIALATFFVGLLSAPSAQFFFAYWTNLSLVLTVFYLLFSFINTIFPSQIQQTSESVRGRARWTWILFVAGVHGQVRAFARAFWCGNSGFGLKDSFLFDDPHTKCFSIFFFFYRSCSSWLHSCGGSRSTIQLRRNLNFTTFPPTE